jgi:hypothetical protein
LKNFVVETPQGKVVFTAETQTPRVLLIHGFRRIANQLLPWRELVPDLGFVHLPGHNGAPALSEVSVRAWIESLTHMMQVFPTPPLLIAESLGATVALCLPSRALIAVEPILSTHQLWPLWRQIENGRARGLEIGPEYEALFAEPFHWVLDRIRAPTLVLAGREPLMPERDVRPSLLSDEDFAAYASHPQVEARRIGGGHVLLDFNREGVMRASAGFMRRHGYLPADV